MKTVTHITGTTIAALLFTFSACSKMDDEDPSTTTVNKQAATENIMKEGGNNPDEAVFNNALRTPKSNYLYTQSNNRENQIYIYKDSYGRLEFVAAVPTGGEGNALSLESQGAVILNANHKYLYAVNAGSNTISSFRMMGDGNLTLKQRIASGGNTPVSLAIYENTLYVAHSGDGTINGFHLDADGNLSHIGGSKKLLSTKNAGPGDISFSPDGKYLYVTERTTNIINMFRVNTNGSSGLRVPIASVGNTPFGFSFARDGYMVVSNAEMGIANHSSATSYSAESGHLSVIERAVPNGQTSACWVATSLHGRYAFVSNTDTDNLSSYYVTDKGSLQLAKDNISSGDAPSDLVVGPDNYSVYVLCGKSHTIQRYTREELGGLFPEGEIIDLPINATGLAVW
jgi:6-phosphogluconolactonase